MNKEHVQELVDGLNKVLAELGEIPTQIDQGNIAEAAYLAGCSNEWLGKVEKYFREYLENLEEE